MAWDIRHQGVVDMIDGQTVVVRIIQTAACGECQARNHCRAAGNNEKKVVEVQSTDAGVYQVGQTVTLYGAKGWGMKAVWLAFGLPLFLLFIALVTAVMLSRDDRVAAIAALGVLVPYYIGLYFFRDRLKSVFQFRIIG
ncbi:MAG: SoxR reducing system RseC family protein [Spirochaetia bacterium]|nr:SoxR reducing system RseC family protein [Spirochaetia bacterium]